TSSRRSGRAAWTSYSRIPRSRLSHDQATTRPPSRHIRNVHSGSRPSCCRKPQVTSPTCHAARAPSRRRCSRASSCIPALIAGVSRPFDELEIGAAYRSRFGRTVLDASTEWGKPHVDSTFTLALVTGPGPQPARRGRGRVRADDHGAAERP